MGAIPARLVGGERVAPPEPVEDAGDPVAVPGHDGGGTATGRGGPARAAGGGRAALRRTNRQPPARPRSCRSKESDQQRLVDRVGGTHSKRTPSRASRRAKRRSWRTNDPDGPSPYRGERQRDARAGDQRRSRARRRAGSPRARPGRRCGPGAASPRSRRRARQPPPRRARAARASRSGRRHRGRCPRWRRRAPRPASERCSGSRARLSATSASSRPDGVRHAARRVGGRSATVSHQARTQSGDWK